MSGQVEDGRGIRGWKKLSEMLPKPLERGSGSIGKPGFGRTARASFVVRGARLVDFPLVIRLSGKDKFGRCGDCEGESDMESKNCIGGNGAPLRDAGVFSSVS
jgi:hypothetical protein